MSTDRTTGRRDAWKLAEIVFWLIFGFFFLDSLTTAWFELRTVPLTDQNAYLPFARESRLFFDSGEREPLHVFFVKVALAFAASDDQAVRAVGFADTLALFAVVVAWMRARYGFVAAVASAVALSRNRFLIFYGVQGFNMSTYLLALASFAAALDLLPTVRSNRPFLVGTMAGLSALARLEGILVSTGCAIAEVVGERTSAKDKLRFLSRYALVLAIWVAPYLAYQWTHFGSPFHRLELDARYWDNTEAIQDRKLPPGASRETGGPMELRTYLMKEGIPALGSRLATGYGAACANYLPRLFAPNYWVLGLALLGFAHLTWVRRWGLPMLSLLVVLPISFILPVDQIGPGSGVEMRFLLPLIVPLIALCGAGTAFLTTIAGRIAGQL